MLGTVGVAPAGGEVRSSLVPDRFGGPPRRAGAGPRAGLRVDEPEVDLGAGQVVDAPAVARVAARTGIPYALSTMGTTSIERLAAAAPTGRRWFHRRAVILEFYRTRRGTGTTRRASTDDPGSSRCATRGVQGGECSSRR